MITVGSHFAFVILVMGTILDAQDISEKDEKNFIVDILDAHNHFRYKHASGPLKLSGKLCKMAKQRAHEMTTKNYSFLSPAKYSENFSVTDFDGISGLNPFKIVSDWYQYENIYDYNEEPSELRINKFTNMVWKSTKKIGVGIFINDNKCYVSVIYSPGGSKRGQYALNITDPNVAALLNQQETNKLLDILEEQSG